MIYECLEGIYLFGFDCLNDTSCVWDMYYESVSDCIEYCSEVFAIDDYDWIKIADPEPNCQHDFILPTKKSQSNKGYLSFLSGKWIDNDVIANPRIHSFYGLTGNERLFMTGLIDEFDKANINDRLTAKRILDELGIG